MQANVVRARAQREVPTGIPATAGCKYCRQNSCTGQGGYIYKVNASIVVHELVRPQHIPLE